MTQALQSQLKIAATYMRGGTSKGVFFALDDLPVEAQQPGPARDALLLRVIGSPDPYGKQTDGMGGATSSTSKTVIVSKSQQPDHDVDYLFGQVAIDRAFVDWSGNCGNLTAAVGAFAIAQGLISSDKLPRNGVAEVRIWQANIAKTIIAKVPMRDGLVQELGDFELDGVTFPAAEVQVEFVSPSAADARLFPSGNLVDRIHSDDFGEINATFINAGIPTIFVNAAELGFSGCELQGEINSNRDTLAKLERLRAQGALQMGLISSLEEAKTRQHTPKLAWVAAPQDYQASSGKAVNAHDVDLLVRAMSMGQLHHAMMGTAAVAIAAAAAVPGTLVHQAANSVSNAKRDKADNSIVFGHPSGTLKVGAKAHESASGWHIDKAIMSRSARVLMEGWVRVPKCW
ncbi:2-methylaconitate cis-trans isomerase PrpF [Paraferrimonas haliotis]|uniref:2-methylaconitate cis-trans isomerase PrpF n=1 Tax=Paraferrimonas haliotis TaxID=2013866 RepID=UPI000BA907F3|nr:2-methylaconitate cis-trans isomerase PrpF [Paraferrimonas haliotis]